MTYLYVLTLFILIIYSYGFVDPNLSNNQIAAWLSQNRDFSAAVFFSIIILLFLFYIYFLRQKKIKKLILVLPIILILSYPAFSYDIFNYILTAKLTYFYKENPYVVMPIEIPNEPMLAFTRASNKLALYGPTWLGIAFLPHVLGMGNIWQTILSFKITVAAFYFFLLWLIYKITKDIRSVIFFGLNPLVVIETLVSGHNDVVMMGMALVAYLAGWWGIILILLSSLVKGATIVLLPLFKRKLFKTSFWLMFFVFLLSPLREELYPWYAIWFLTFAAVLPWRRESFIRNFSIVLSFGLLLRYLPYLVTNSYSGWTPVLRIILTVVPVGIYLLFLWSKRYLLR